MLPNYFGKTPFHNAHDESQELEYVHTDRKPLIRTMRADHKPAQEASRSQYAASLPIVECRTFPPSSLHRNPDQSSTLRHTEDDRALREVANTILRHGERSHMETTMSPADGDVENTTTASKLVHDKLSRGLQHENIFPEAIIPTVIADSQSSKVIIVDSDPEDDNITTIPPKPYFKRSSSPSPSPNIARFSQNKLSPVRSEVAKPVSPFTSLRYKKASFAPKIYRSTFSPPRHAVSTAIRAPLRLKPKGEVRFRVAKPSLDEPKSSKAAGDPTDSFHEKIDLFTHTISAHIKPDSRSLEPDHYSYHTTCTKCYKINLDATNWDPANHQRTIARFPELAKRETHNDGYRRAVLAGTIITSGADDGSIRTAKKKGEGVEGLDWLITESESEDEYQQVAIKKERREQWLRQLGTWITDDDDESEEQDMEMVDKKILRDAEKKEENKRRSSETAVASSDDESEDSEYWEYNEE
ncbi:hypothetical protein H2198_010606 [Neophaeococcomyces mojaviensis]|uniref:Uncharacterized protein n=1 Tax=Neophaeococcomyces mojaviensis TaxID=3383035 RepID=A0ACC2ZR35_9EURO|nr:hypothetical protein H2198_010606 [Knufia sp. JES_112]